MTVARIAALIICAALAGGCGAQVSAEKADVATGPEPITAIAAGSPEECGSIKALNEMEDRYSLLADRGNAIKYPDWTLAEKTIQQVARSAAVALAGLAFDYEQLDSDVREQLAELRERGAPERLLRAWDLFARRAQSQAALLTVLGDYLAGRSEVNSEAEADRVRITYGKLSVQLEALDNEYNRSRVILTDSLCPSE